MNKWDKLASSATIQKTVAALRANGINAVVVANREEAKKKVLELIPAGAEVMDMTSVTLETIQLAHEIREEGRFDSVRKKFIAMDRETQHKEMNRLGATSEWVVGSVHAVTTNGTVLVASNSGSQIPAYAYGASHVIWLVGTQKIVKNVDEGMRRIYEYTLPLESERARKAYGVAGSNVSKILIINKEIKPGRITLIFIREKLGF